MEERNPFFIVDGNVHAVPEQKTGWYFLRYLEIKLPGDAEILLLGLYPKEANKQKRQPENVF